MNYEKEFEQRQLLIPVEITMICWKCRLGNLNAVEKEFTHTLAEYPIKYEHRCTNEKCGNRANFFKIYPRIEHEPYYPIDITDVSEQNT